jgi:hypothetical protein
MKSRTVSIALVGGIHFLVCASVMVLFYITGYNIVFDSPSAVWQSVALGVLTVLLHPIAWLPFPDSLVGHSYTAWLAIALNSIVWGVSLGLLIHGVRHWLDGHDAYPSGLR